MHYSYTAILQVHNIFLRNAAMRHPHMWVIAQNLCNFACGVGWRFACSVGQRFVAGVWLAVSVQSAMSGAIRGDWHVRDKRRCNRST